MLFVKIILLISLIALFSTSICKGKLADELTKRFNESKCDCHDQHNKKHPAYMCSGLLIRGVRDSDVGQTLRHAWSFKAGNHEKKSFSVAFLRRDTPFAGFPSGYVSGFILFPHLDTPRIKNTYKVYCKLNYN